MLEGRGYNKEVFIKANVGLDSGNLIIGYVFSPKKKMFWLICNK